MKKKCPRCTELEKQIQELQNERDALRCACAVLRLEKKLLTKRNTKMVLKAFRLRNSDKKKWTWPAIYKYLKDQGEPVESLDAIRISVPRFTKKLLPLLTEISALFKQWTIDKKSAKAFVQAG